VKQSKVEIISHPIIQQLCTAGGGPGGFTGTTGALGSFPDIGGGRI